MKINLKETKEEWLKTSGQYQIKTIADHYGIYEHLFGEAYFVPRIPLQIVFNQESVNIPVYFGNVIKPSEATNLPEISFDGGDSLWTLIMTNPDGHFTKQDAEYVHLFMYVNSVSFQSLIVFLLLAETSLEVIFRKERQL